jgi:photosystem II stability/assembly factor-like uncharacterized protein
MRLCVLLLVTACTKSLPSSGVTEEWKVTSASIVPLLDIWGNSSTNLFILSENTLQHSSDGGTTWNDVDLRNPSTGEDASWGKPADSNRYVESYRQISGVGSNIWVTFLTKDDSIYGVYFSNDNGTTWRRYSIPASQNSYLSGFVRLLGDERRFVLMSSEASIVSLASTTDAGKTWEKTLGQILPGQPAPSIIVGPNEYNQNAWTISHRTEGQKEWSQLWTTSTPLSRSLWPSLWIGSPTNIYIGEGTHLFHSKDGKTFDEFKTSWDVLTLYGIGENDAYFGGRGVVFHSSDNGTTWSQSKTSTPFGEVVKFWGTEPKHVYAITNKGELLRPSAKP